MRIFLFLLFCSELLMSSGVLKALTIEEAIEEALKNNPNLVDLRAQRDASRAKTLQAESSFFPSLSFGFTYSRVSSVPTFPGGVSFGYPDNYSGQFQLQYPIFSWGRRGKALDLANIGVKNSQVQIEIKELEIRYMVTQAFYGVLLAENGVKLAREAKKRAEDHLRSVLEKYKAGRVSDLDTLRAHVSLSKAAVQVLKTEHQLETARQQLALLLGRNPKSSVKVEGELSVEEIKIPLERCEEIALKRRKELISLNFARKGLELSEEITKSTLRPSVGVMLNYRFEKPFQYFENRWGRLFTAGISLNFPIFDGFSTQGKIKEIEAKERSLDAQEKALKDMIRFEVREAVNSYKEAMEVLKMQEEAVRQAKRALEVAKEQYKAGFLSELDYQDVEFGYTQAQFQKISTLYSAIVAKAQLLRAMGIKDQAELEDLR